MIDGIEQIFQTIADSIQDAIPEEWTTATMEAEFYPHGSRYVGEYTREADGETESFATDLRSERAFRELRERFKEAGKPLWGRACFELNADGKFNMKWGYDDCDEDGYAIFHE